jgi:hypothetical protein
VIEPAAEIIARLRREYAEAVDEGRGANPWLDRAGRAMKAAE